MRRRWKIVLLVLVALCGASAWAMHALLYTPAGLQFLLRQVERLQVVKITATGADGMLAGPLEIDHLVVDHEAVHIDARKIAVHPQLGLLFSGLVKLEGLEVGRLEVTLKPRPPQPPSTPHFLPAWLRIEAPGFAANRVVVTLVNGTRIPVQRVTGSLRMSRWRFAVRPLQLEDPAGAIDGRVRLRASEPLGLRARARGHWTLPDQRTYRFDARVRGDLDRLGVTAAMEAPAQLSFAGTLFDLTRKPRATGTLRVVDFDGSPWIEAGKVPKLSGSITLAAGTESLGLDGTLTSPALDGGQLRLQGSGRMVGRQLQVADFKTWMPRNGLELTTSGTVTLRPEGAPELALTGAWSNLRWPLGTGQPPVVESPAGAYSLNGALPYTFETRAVVRGAAIPEVSFSSVGSFDAGKVVVEDVDGYALRGRVSGSGSLAWTGAQPWRFQFAGRSLDVHELRRDVTGHIDLSGSIEGQGLSAAAPWTLRLASLSGTVLGRALTGRGEISHRDGDYELVGVRVANGGSHVDVDGRIGRTLDLRWDADLRSLAVVANGLDGRLVSRGTAHGTLARPKVRGEVRATALSYGAFSVDAIDGDIDVDTTDAQASHLDVTARGLRAGKLALDSVRFRGSGLLRDNGIDIELASSANPALHLAQFRGRIGLRGNFDVAGRRWFGTLDSADVRFDEDKVSLIQPAALDLGPSLVHAAPICLQAGDSRLCVEGERHATPDSWRVLYSAQDWPLRRILRTLLGRRDFDGLLQASGWLEKEPGKDWVGGTTLLVDKPTLDIPRNQFRSERVELGGGRVDLYADADAFRANLDLTLGAGTTIRGEAHAVRTPGADPLASPLSGAVTGQSSALAAIPLFIPEIDRSEGKLEGQVTLGGTLGDPSFRGEFHVRDGRFELYRTNLVLTGVALDGRFVGDLLEIGGRAETPRGPMTLDGRFRWPDGVMTGSMHLAGTNLLVADTPAFHIIASPDLTLTAGPDGYFVTGDIVVPNAKISPRDLSSSVSTSPDERIVGREEETEPATSERVASRIRVVLGDQVRVETYGLKARLGGEVTVLTKPGDVARGRGTITVVEGQYKAFGQDLKITKGKLSYADTPLSDPSLEIVAEREIKDADVTVAVNVRGTLEKPFVTISSTPAMSDSEALSYLLTGRSIDTLQSGEATSVNNAAESLAMSGGGLLLGGIGTKLGLDEVSVARTESNDTSVTLGKYLSPKLFVSYGVSIAEAINTIKLRYTINKRWALKAEAGLVQGADVEYKIEH